jgi:hypothetical protein
MSSHIEGWEHVYIHVALPNKEADTVLGGLKLALQRIRPGGQKKIVLRFHTDDDASFKGSVKAFAAEEGWLQTTRTGYDHVIQLHK